MASILRKGLLLVLAGLFVSCFMLGCQDQATTTAPAGTGSSMDAGNSMSAPSAMDTGMKEQPKSSWGDETRQGIVNEPATP